MRHVRDSEQKHEAHSQPANDKLSLVAEFFGELRSRFPDVGRCRFILPRFSFSYARLTKLHGAYERPDFISFMPPGSLESPGLFAAREIADRVRKREQATTRMQKRCVARSIATLRLPRFSDVPLYIFLSLLNSSAVIILPA